MPQRHAYICTHKECVPPIRVFLDAAPERPPKCPEHTGTTMVHQVNAAKLPRRRPQRPAG